MPDASPLEISASDLLARRARGEARTVLDVREPNEWNLFRIPDAVHLPLAKVGDAAADAFSRFPSSEEIVVYCGRGARSAQAVSMMRAKGMKATSLAGGIAAWIDAGGEVED